MELILWRHAEAEDGSPDFERKLTSKGRRQAKHMARWLDNLLPRNARILVSPAVRTRQTADALKSAYQLADGLAPDRSMEDMIAAVGRSSSNATVVLVGHNPAISALASHLLNGGKIPVTVRKGAAWWFSNSTVEGEQPVILRAVMSPGLAAGLPKKK